jgi:hypothetical protein
MDVKMLFTVAIVLLAGCSSVTAREFPEGMPHAFPDKAIVDVVAVTEAVEIEKATNANSETPAPNGAQWFEVIEGEAPVIVTAPHATKPFREGQYRFSDGGGTAALARMLNKLSGATVIYTTFASPSDPNYYDDNAFKAALAALIVSKRPVLVLDLHGSHSYRPYDVDLGTMNGQSLQGKDALVADIVRTLKAEGLANLSYNYFAASQNQTITKFVAARGVPAIQLEISSTWLAPSQDNLSAHRFAQLLQAMIRYIDAQTKLQPSRPE